MTKITIDRATVGQVARLLNDLEKGKAAPTLWQVRTLLEGLQKALEQPEQEPVAPDDESICDDWISASDSDGIAYDGPSFECGYKIGRIAERDAQPEQEPIGYLWPTGMHPKFRYTKQKRDGVDGTPVYLAARAVQRMPLTDEEIGQTWSVADGEHNASGAVKRRITRSIEAAHGIKEPKP